MYPPGRCASTQDGTRHGRCRWPRDRAPALVHVFGAAKGSGAEVFVALRPGIERFGYFDQLAPISRGEAESLIPEQDQYDVHPSRADAAAAP